MFKINDFIVYGSSEVCVVKDIAVPDFLKTEEPYYYLQPLYSSSSTLYVKTTNPQKPMRSLLSIEQAKSFLSDYSKLEPLYDDNDKLREKEYADIFQSCDFIQWMQMLKGIIGEKKRRNSIGKKLNMNDEKNLSRVENCITAEFSGVFHVSLEYARDYVISLETAS